MKVSAGTASRRNSISRPTQRASEFYAPSFVSILSCGPRMLPSPQLHTVWLYNVTIDAMIGRHQILL